MSDPGDAQYVVRVSGPTSDGFPKWLFIPDDAAWRAVDSPAGATRLTWQHANRCADMARDRLPRSCGVSVQPVSVQPVPAQPVPAQPVPGDGKATKMPTYEEALAALRKADEAFDAISDAKDRQTFSSWEVAGARVREYRALRGIR